MRAACIGRLCSDIPLQSIVDASFELSDAAKLLLVNGMCDEARDMLLAEDDDVEANTIQRTVKLFSRQAWIWAVCSGEIQQAHLVYSCDSHHRYRSIGRCDARYTQSGHAYS